MNKREAKRIALKSVASFIDANLYYGNDLTGEWPENEDDWERVRDAADELLKELHRRAWRLSMDPHEYRLLLTGQPD